MASKLDEVADLRALQRTRPELQIVVVEERESPDFVVMSGSRRVAIEHTRFSLRVDKGYPHPHEQAALQARVVTLACQKYQCEGGKPLYLEVEFDEYPPLSKQRVPVLAQGLANLATGLRGPLIHYRKQVFPANGDYLPEIAAIRGRVICSASPSSWLTVGQNWPARAGQADVDRVIAAKERRVAVYREVCPEVWLLVVFEYEPGRFQVKPPAETNLFSVATGFNRIFCLDPVAERCIELPTTRDPAPAA